MSHAQTVLQTQQVRVSDYYDDAEQRPGGYLNLTNNDLELATDSQPQLVGIRFNGLLIPRGATVTNAYIQFTADESTSDAVSLFIRAEAADNASQLTSENTVSDRSLTSAAVNWVPPPWQFVGEAGADQRTPDISQVVQEVVNRSGWQLEHSLLFVIDGTGERVAEAFDGEPDAAPLLVVEYELTDQEAPIVEAGSDQTIVMPAGASLSGIVSDDGQPDPPAAITSDWSQISGPGEVYFDDSTLLSTTANFSLAGAYDLRLKANDSEQISSDEIRITVDPSAIPPALSSFEPASSQVAMVITLSGNNFSSVHSVTFNGIPSSFRIESDNTIHANVPPGAAGGIITISNPWGTANSATAFNLISSPAVLVGAGDISNCDGNEEDVAQLLDAIPGTVFTTGDNVYRGATQSIFDDCYDPTWGRHKDRTRPVVGNTDYAYPGAENYYDYFGLAAGESDKGYYSYDVGDWHIVALNSQCHEVGGCERNSKQGIWFREDLARNPQTCTAVLWHHPRYGTAHDGDDRMIDFWEIAYDAGVELIINGHDHNYERFALLDPYGNPDPNGIREIIVGTGGIYLAPLDPVVPNSLVTNDDTHGVLKLDLYSSSYDWEFIPIAGGTFTDSGSGVCQLVNQSPVVVAGKDQALEWPAGSIELAGSVIDDGYPLSPGALSVQWSKINGPGDAIFANSQQDSTTVDFTMPGRYVLQLSGDDGEKTATEEIEILLLPSGSTLVNEVFTVSSGNDDAEESVATGEMYLDSSDLELVLDDSTVDSEQIVGLRFKDVNIPQNAVILSSTLQFVVDEVSTEPAELMITGEASDDSAAFTQINDNLSSRSTTLSSVPWSPGPWAAVNDDGDDQRTPELNPIIQEITDRNGWSSGNALSLFISGSGKRVAESFDGEQDAAAMLLVEYLILPAPLTVDIDVLPGDTANVVYPNRSGDLPVAVLSTATFDALTADPSTLRLGAGEAAYTGSVETGDVDGQYGADLTVRFPVQNTGILCNDTEVELYGETFGGMQIEAAGTMDASQCETGGCHVY